MPKARIWSSAAGFSALIFYLIGVAGAVLQFIGMYLPALDEYTTGGEILYLIAFIINTSVALFAVLSIIISIFGIPKFLWILFAFLSLACIVAIPIISVILGNSFLYIDLTHFDNYALDFIGFWVGVGGTFFATFIGLFVPKYY